jgi:hypothetical protein
LFFFHRTLIFEEVRNQWNPDDPLPTGSPGPSDNDKLKYKISTRLYGWSAQYSTLLPTKKSLGAADYVDLPYLKERDKTFSEVDCHVPMFDAPKTFGEGFNKGPVPTDAPFVTPYMTSLRRSKLFQF